MNRRTVSECSYIVAFIVALMFSLIPGPVLGQSERTLSYFDEIEAIPSGSIVVLAFDTGPEGWTTEYQYALGLATMQHLFYRINANGIKVVMLTFWSTGAELLVNCYGGVYGPMDQMGAVYGEDWVNLGHIAGMEVGMSAFADDVWGAKPTDYYGTFVGEIPLMQEVRSVHDIYMLISIESGTPGLTEYLRQWWSRKTTLKILIGCLEVMTPGVEPYYPHMVNGYTSGSDESSQYELLLMENYGYTPLIPPLKTLLGTGWGWMRIAHKEYVYGPAELYKIGEEQIELVVEEYSRTWNIIHHREYTHHEIYFCQSQEHGVLIVGLQHARWTFWYAVGKDTIAFGHPRFGRPRLMLV